MDTISLIKKRIVMMSRKPTIKGRMGDERKDEG
jgi:hypothetical protein